MKDAFYKRLKAAMLAATMLMFALQAAAQVTLSLTVKPPYSPMLNDYRHLENRAIITLVNTTANPMQVKLVGSLTNVDKGISIQTNNDYRPSVPVTVAPHGSTTVTANPGAMNFLDQGNATTNASDNIKQDIVRTGLLPEGVYRLCIDVVGYNTNAMLSVAGQGCSSFNITLAQPPTITYPMDGQTIPATQNAPTFSWTPPVGNLAGAAVRYRLVVVEVIPGQNPNDAISVARDYKANNPTINMDNMLSQIYVVQPSDLSFKAGITYAAQVIASDANGKLVIANNGASGVVVFQIGSGQKGKTVHAIDTNGVTTEERVDFPNQLCGPMECAPTAASNSLLWLNDLFGMGLDEKDISIEALKIALKTGKNGSPNNWWELKKNYCEKKHIPVTTEPIAIDEIDKLVSKYNEKCDIEITIDKFHTAAIVKIEGSGNDIVITVADDVLQQHDKNGSKVHKIRIRDKKRIFFVHDDGTETEATLDHTYNPYFACECVETKNIAKFAEARQKELDASAGIPENKCNCGKIDLKKWPPETSAKVDDYSKGDLHNSIKIVLGERFFYALSFFPAPMLVCEKDSKGDYCEGTVYIKGSIGASSNARVHNLKMKCKTTPAHEFKGGFNMSSPFETTENAMKNGNYPVELHVYVICGDNVDEYTYNGTLSDGKLIPAPGGGYTGKTPVKSPLKENIINEAKDKRIPHSDQWYSPSQKK